MRTKTAAFAQHVGTAGTESGSRTVLLVHHGAQWIRGSERCLIDHVAALDRRRFTPVVWTNCLPLADLMDSMGVTAVRDRFTVMLDGRAPHFDVASSIGLIRRTLRLIRQHDVDLIHANATEPCQFLIPAARYMDVPVVLQLHLETGLRSRCVRLAHQATVLTGVSGAAVDPFLQDGVPSESVRIIHPTVDAARLTGQPKVSRDEIDVAKDAFVFLAVGSLIQHKGFDLLLRAFAALTLTGRPLQLVIAGDGPARHELHRLAADLKIEAGVRFLGDVPAPALMRDIADAVVLTSRREAFGLVLIEAGFFGLPCIATDVGGVGEIIRDLQTGFLVPGDNVDALRAAMERCYSEPEFARRLGQQLRSTVLNAMLAPAATRQLEEIYQQCLSQRTEMRTTTGWRWYPVYGRYARHVVRSLSGRGSRRRASTIGGSATVP